MLVRAILSSLAVALVVSACGAAEPAATTTETPATQARTATPTVRPTVQAVAEVTAVPTDEPTTEPTAKPTPTAKPPKIEYAKLSDRAWKKLVKAPDNYVAKAYRVWACISQFDAATGLDTFRGQASNKKRTYWYTDGANALFTGDEDKLDEFVEGDVVSMNVLVLGSFTYDTQVGGSTTVPWFSVEKITRKGDCD
jgi:hypothetical protein